MKSVNKRLDYEYEGRLTLNYEYNASTARKDEKNIINVNTSCNKELRIEAMVYKDSPAD